jgi:hypothetical protein
MILNKELMQDSLRYVLDKRKQPMLILDSTNAFVGILRKMLHWNYSSIVAEYRVFSGGKSHYMTEIFLELLEIKCLDHDEHWDENHSHNSNDAVQSNHNNELVVSFPSDEILPEWFVFQRDLWRKDQQDQQEQA